MDDKTKKEVLAAWHARKQEEITQRIIRNYQLIRHILNTQKI